MLSDRLGLHLPVSFKFSTLLTKGETYHLKEVVFSPNLALLEATCQVQLGLGDKMD